MKKNKQTANNAHFDEQKALIINDILMVMKHKKIKRKHLCADTGVSISFLSDVFNMKKNPSYDTLLRIAKAVGSNLRIIPNH